MRTPLTNIVMPLELIVNNKFDDPEEQVKFLRIALSNVDRLESLVTDFVLLTNIDHGNLNRIRQTIDVNNHILFPCVSAWIDINRKIYNLYRIFRCRAR